MAENIDVDVSGVLSGAMNLKQAGRLIMEKVLDVASGGMVSAEKLGHCEVGFHRIGPTL